jgi:riboflavin kinase / FMN adenylyltransferase
MSGTAATIGPIAVDRHISPLHNFRRGNHSNGPLTDGCAAVKLFRDLETLPAALRSGAVTIGNFDGVHLGHALIVERLLARARQVGGPAVVFTFDPHPVRLLRPDAAPPPLTWTDRKAELLARLGVDAVLAYPTDEALLALEPDLFFDQIVRSRLDARSLVEGANFRFGRGRAGTIDLLRKFANAADIVVEVVEPVVVAGEIVSSSRVRRLLADGQVGPARRLLTQPYRVRGMVVHGAGRGAKIGFATANVDAIDTILPGAGVYAGRALVAQKWWPAAINVGASPTFGESIAKVEAHLIGWHDPLYGSAIEIDFLERLRGVERFATVAELRDQLARDTVAAEQIAAGDDPPRP